MTPLAVRVPAVNRKRIRLFRIVRARGIEEWIAAFRAEKVQLVIVPLAEVVVVERDEARIDNGCLAVKALVGEFLSSAALMLDSRRDSLDDKTLCPATRTS
jgi:hypothetical protein